MKILSFLFVNLFFCGCASRLELSTNEHDDIAEAVFRYMCQAEPVEEEITHNIKQIHKVYFFAFDNSTDPTSDFFKRFNDFKTLARPYSTGVWRQMFIYDKTTGERGEAFYIRKISMRSRRTAEVEAAIHPGGGLSASGSIYHVSLKNGKWVVISERLKWIS